MRKNYLLLLLGFSSLIVLIVSRVPAGASPVKSIALIYSHSEGNLGDEMETVPLVKQLSDWGMDVHLFSSPWRKDRPVGAAHLRTFQYIRSFTWDWTLMDLARPKRTFDAIIWAPGPFVEGTEHFAALVDATIARPPRLIWFGLSQSAPDVYANSSLILNHLDLAVFREMNSYNLFLLNLSKSNVGYKTKVLFSGDLSHSFPLLPVLFDYWKSYFALKNFVNCTIIFPRVSLKKPSSGIWIANGTLFMRLLKTEQVISLPIDPSVVFASSSELEDFRLPVELTDAGVNSRNLVMCQSVEQLWGLIAISRRVYSERYHPSIAALNLNIPHENILFLNEKGKFLGESLNAEFDTATFAELNRNAFDALFKTLTL